MQRAFLHRRVPSERCRHKELGEALAASWFLSGGRSVECWEAFGDREQTPVRGDPPPDHPMLTPGRDTFVVAETFDELIALEEPHLVVRRRHVVVD